MTSVYLDYNATTPLRPSVKTALVSLLNEVGNPSSIHQHGRTSRKHLEKTRQILSTVFGCGPHEVTFTSGATEANNQILRGFEGTVIMSAIEHSSVRNVRSDARICPVDKNGVLDLESLDRLLSEIEWPVLVAVMFANNETGVVQPLTDVISLVKKREKAWVHCDVVQGLGKITTDFRTLGADTYSLSGHKIGGPSGSGAMIHKEGFPLKPLIGGGGQERFMRSGTPNILGIVGLGIALEDCFKDNWKDIERLRNKMEADIKAICPHATIFGASVHRLPNTSCFTMPGVRNDTQAINFDLAKISLSAGSACSSGTVKPSSVLLAMGVSEEEALSAIRVSLGWETTQKEIEIFIDQWAKIYHRCRNEGEQKQ